MSMRLDRAAAAISATHTLQKFKQKEGATASFKLQEARAQSEEASMENDRREKLKTAQQLCDDILKSWYEKFSALRNECKQLVADGTSAVAAAS